MRLKHYILFAIMAGALVSCGAPKKAIVDAKSDNFIIREPGNWRVTTTILKYEVPSLPAEAQQSMKALINVPEVTEICVTDKDTRQDTLRSRLAEAMMLSDNCKVGDMANGQNITINSVCKNNETETVTMTYTGSISPIDTQLTVEMNGKDAATGATSIFSNKVNRERIGAC